MKAWLVAGIVLIAATMVWLAALSEHWKYAYYFRGRQDDYYNLLVHGFLRGHLYMELPASATSAPQDASLYHGNYYLYFGVVPAVLAFLPYRLVTGQDLSENAVCVAFVFLGFLAYLRLYTEAARRYFPTLSRPLRAGSVVLLAFGAGTPFLLAISHWYEIAIASGYACMAAAWLAMFRAWHATDRGGRGLAGASLALGLAAGCRPNYIFALPVLAGLAFVLLRRARPRARAGLAAATVLPAAAVGLLLMAYNYARFGSPFEFGFRYQLSELVAKRLPLARLSFFWPNLQWYYLRPPAFSPYFPYIFPMNAGDRPDGYYGYETIQGQWLVLLLALAGLVGLWALRRRCRASGPGLPGFLLFPAAAFACLFLSESFFGFRADRYLVDFQGSLVLFLALLGGTCATAFPPRLGWARMWRGGFALLAALAGVGNVLGSLQLSHHLEETEPHEYRELVHDGGYPSLLLGKIGLLHYGPIRFKVAFARVAREVSAPLVATGVPYQTDVLRAIQRPPNLVEFQLEHDGRASTPRSKAFPVEFGREYEVEVALGSLYPPRIHPYFDGWRPEDVDLLKNTAHVKFAGEEAIFQKTFFFDAPPNWIFLGKDPAGMESSFTGKITARQNLAADTRSTLDPFARTGTWRLQVGFSSLLLPMGQPLLASGSAGHGNLLFVHVLPHQSVRFSQDQWGGALTSSPVLTVSPGLHRVEVFAGPQVARRPLPPEWRLPPGEIAAASSALRVWLDGVPVWTTTVSFNQDSYDEVAVGANPQGFSTAESEWGGVLGLLPFTPQEMRAFIERNLQETSGSGR
jgi:hypothetical protein